MPRQLELAFCSARPVVKWPGGKTRLLEQLLPLLPADVECRRHIEPFAGGAAMYFRLTPTRAVLRDANRQLMATYRCIRASVETLIDALRCLARTHCVAQYYAVRSRYNATPHLADSIERCAQFIYLNKTGYNGLHRVNRRGEFNVPAGRPSAGAPRIVDAAGLRAASSALHGVDLQCASFESILDVAGRGDFVYIDSPYDVEPGAKNFTAYFAEPFDEAAQDSLVEVFHTLEQRGCRLMLSNSATERNLQRYRRFDITSVQAPRSINCHGAQRAPVTEIVVRNYA